MRQALLLASLALLFGCDLGLCSNNCATARNGVCEDGAQGATGSTCALGTDCDDCGLRYANSGGGLPPWSSPIGGLGADSDPVGPPGDCVYAAYCRSDGRSYHVRYEDCRTMVPRQCPEHYRCVGTGVLNEDGLEEAEACEHESGDVGRVTLCRDCGECRLTGVKLECCVDYPARIELPRYCQNVGRWSQWYENEDGERADCDPGEGCFVGACNLQAGDVDDICHNIEPGTDVSPACSQRIDDLLDRLRGLGAGTCADRCLNTFEECMRGTNCVEASRCQSNANTCLSGCF